MPETDSALTLVIQESRHAFGMKALGLPNTKHFHEITKIEDALARASQFSSLLPSVPSYFPFLPSSFLLTPPSHLPSSHLPSLRSLPLPVAERLKQDSKQDARSTETMEELEDAEGNVYDKRTYGESTLFSLFSICSCMCSTSSEETSEEKGGWRGTRTNPLSLSVLRRGPEEARTAELGEERVSGERDEYAFLSVRVTWPGKKGGAGGKRARGRGGEADADATSGGRREKREGDSACCSARERGGQWFPLWQRRGGLRSSRGWDGRRLVDAGVHNLHTKVSARKVMKGIFNWV